MTARCHCGRHVPPSSLDGVNCARHDDEVRRPRGPWFYGLEYDGPRCGCGTPVEDDDDLCPECATAIPARCDERYDPSPEPIERRIS